MDELEDLDELEEVADQSLPPGETPKEFLKVEEERRQRQAQLDEEHRQRQLRQDHTGMAMEEESTTTSGTQSRKNKSKNVFQADDDFEDIAEIQSNEVSHNKRKQYQQKDTLDILSEDGPGTGTQSMPGQEEIPEME